MAITITRYYLKGEGIVDNRNNKEGIEDNNNKNPLSRNYILDL